MDIQTSEDNGFLAIEIHGPIIASESPKLRSLISDAIDEQKKIGIDLSGCDYMDSSGLATLVEAVQLAEQEKLTFRIVGTFSDKVRHLLEITRLDELFAEFQVDTMDTARSELSA